MSYPVVSLTLPKAYLPMIPRGLIIALSISWEGTKESLSFSYAEAPQGPVGHIVSNEKGILAVGKNKILLPPLWNKVFCWGFDDFTCCLTGYGSDKVIKDRFLGTDARNIVNYVLRQCA